MEINFSRHATRRAKLYKIPKSAIISILRNKAFSKGSHEIIENIKGFQFPIKIIISVDIDITIITTYPIKRNK